MGLDKVIENTLGILFFSISKDQNSAVVPEGYVLAIGDNYSQSIDSRTYGFVPVKNILGKVLWK